MRVDELIGSTQVLRLTDDVFEWAALVRAQTGLKTPDALHIATALTHSCAELWTADERLAKPTIVGLSIRLVA